MLRLNGDKIFVNLCEHREIPTAPVTLGYTTYIHTYIHTYTTYIHYIHTYIHYCTYIPVRFNKWPLMSVFPGRTVNEASGTYIQCTYTHTYTYIHTLHTYSTYIHTYIHLCHAYIHTYIGDFFVYDAVISSQSMEVCNRDPKAKDAVCMYVCMYVHYMNVCMYVQCMYVCMIDLPASAAAAAQEFQRRVGV